MAQYRLLKNLPEVTVISEGRQGICYAVTTGYQAAYDMKADIICRSDADALPYKDWLLDIETALGRNPEAVAVTGPQTVYDANFLRRGYCLALDWFIARMSRLLMRGTIFFARNKRCLSCRYLASV